MASVRKREWEHNGVKKTAWVVNYTDQSGARRLKTFERKKEAEAYRLEVEVELDHGTHTADRASATVNEAMESYIDDLDRKHRIGKYAGLSKASRESSCRKIREQFGAVLVKDVTREAVEEWVERLAERYKPSTVQMRYSTLLLVLQHAVKKKWIKRNILRDDPVTLPEIKRGTAKMPDRQEIIRLLEVMEDPKAVPQYPRSHLLRRAFVTLGIFGGLRRGEVAGLQWHNVDFDNKVIRVRHSLSVIDGLKSPKTDAGSRDVPMSAPVERALRSLQEYWIMRERVAKRGEREGHTNAKGILSHRLMGLLKKPFEAHPDDEPLTGYVIRTAGKMDFKGGRALGVQKLSTSHWTGIMKAAGLINADGKHKYSTHALRHAAASLLIENGLPAFNLRTVIGHANVNTTYDVYGHLFPDDQRSRKAINEIAGAFDATRERQEKNAA